MRKQFTGIEAVVFVGGVALGQPAKSIPIAAIVGLVCGLICGYLIYQFASRSSKFLLSCFPHLLIIYTSFNDFPYRDDESDSSHWGWLV
jgi:NhaP-type Na+/H+ or K+/H+ antiporter